MKIKIDDVLGNGRVDGTAVRELKYTVDQRSGILSGTYLRRNWRMNLDGPDYREDEIMAILPAYRLSVIRHTFWRERPYIKKGAIYEVSPTLINFKSNDWTIQSKLPLK